MRSTGPRSQQRFEKVLLTVTGTRSPELSNTQCLCPGSLDVTNLDLAVYKSVRPRRRHRFIDPNRPLRTLPLLAAPSEGPVVAVAEALRGRVYSLIPGCDPHLSEPADLPKVLPAVGWLRPANQSLLRAAAVELLPDAELRSFGAAASHILESAPEVAYGSFRVEYRHTLGSAFSRNRWTRT